MDRDVSDFLKETGLHIEVFHETVVADGGDLVSLFSEMVIDAAGYVHQDAGNRIDAALSGAIEQYRESLSRT